MKKHFVIGLIAIVTIMFLSSIALATPAGQNKGPAGYYQHTVTGQIKYFKNGHPGEPSQWKLISKDNPCNDGDCKAKGNLNGTFTQATSAWKADGDFEQDDTTITVNDGAFGSASQTATGAYYGKYNGDGWGVGGALSLGGSATYAKDTDTRAIGAAVTGSVTAAGVGGDLNKQCANINGSGDHMSLAIKSGDMGAAYAMTSGEYAYKGQVGQGVVIGGGITGGGSVAYNGAHHSGAIAGGATISGVGNISMSNPE